MTATGSTDRPACMSTPTFSVLMAAYDTERYVADAVRSVLAQSRSDWELVVVDDGSPDAVAERVEPFLADPRVHLIRQENRGLGATLNVAAAATRGRYLVKLDSDDLLLPGYLASVAETLEARPNVGLVSCDALMLEADGRIRRRTYLQQFSEYQAGSPGQVLSRLLRHNFIYAGSTFRRAVLEECGGFDPDPAVLEDWDMWLRMAAAGVQMEIIPRPLAIYRLRMDSLSRDATGANRLWPRVERTLQKARAEVALLPADERVLRETLVRYEHMSLLGSARSALMAGQTFEARCAAWSAVRVRRSPRAMAIALALELSPGVVRRISRTRRMLLPSLRPPWVRPPQAGALNADAVLQRACTVARGRR